MHITGSFNSVSGIRTRIFVPYLPNSWEFLKSLLARNLEIFDSLRKKYWSWIFLEENWRLGKYFYLNFKYFNDGVYLVRNRHPTHLKVSTIRASPSFNFHRKIFSFNTTRFTSPRLVNRGPRFDFHRGRPTLLDSFVSAMPQSARGLYCSHVVSKTQPFSGNCIKSIKLLKRCLHGTHPSCWLKKSS